MSNSYNIQQLYRKAQQLKSLANTTRYQLISRIKKYNIVQEDVNNEYKNQELIKEYGKYLEKLRPDLNNIDMFKYPNINLVTKTETLTTNKSIKTKTETRESISDSWTELSTIDSTKTEITVKSDVSYDRNGSTVNSSTIYTSSTDSGIPSEYIGIVGEYVLADQYVYPDGESEATAIKRKIIKTTRNTTLTVDIVNNSVNLADHVVELLLLNDTNPNDDNKKYTFIIGVYKYSNKAFVSVDLLKVDSDYMNITELSKPIEIATDTESIVFNNVYSIHQLGDSTTFYKIESNPVGATSPTNTFKFKLVVIGDVNSFYKSAVFDLNIETTSTSSGGTTAYTINPSLNNIDVSVDRTYNGDIKSTSTIDEYVNSVGVSNSGTLTSELLMDNKTIFSFETVSAADRIFYISNQHINTRYCLWDEHVNTSFINCLIYDPERSVGLMLKVSTDNTRAYSNIELTATQVIIDEDNNTGGIDSVVVNYDKLHKMITVSYRDRIIMYSSINLLKTNGNIELNDVVIVNRHVVEIIISGAGGGSAMLKLYENNKLQPFHYMSNLEGRWLNAAVLYNGVRYFAGITSTSATPNENILTFLKSLQFDYTAIGSGFDANYNLILAKMTNNTWTKNNYSASNISTGKWHLMEKAVESYITMTNEKWKDYDGIKGLFPDVELDNNSFIRYNAIYHIWSANNASYMYFITYSRVNTTDPADPTSPTNDNVYLLVKDANQTFINDDVNVVVSSIEITDTNLMTMIIKIDSSDDIYCLRLRFSKIFERYWKDEENDKNIMNAGYVKRYHIERKLMCSGEDLNGKLISAVSIDYGDNWEGIEFENNYSGVLNGLSSYCLTKSSSAGSSLLNNHYGYLMIGVDNDEHANVFIYNKLINTWYDGFYDIFESEHFMTLSYSTTITENSYGDDDITIVITPTFNPSFVDTGYSRIQSTTELTAHDYIMNMHIEYKGKWSDMSQTYQIPFSIFDTTEGRYSYSISEGVDGLTIQLNCDNTEPKDKYKTRYFKFVEKNDDDHTIRFIDETNNKELNINLDYTVFSKLYYRNVSHLENVETSAKLTYTNIYNNYWIRLFKYNILTSLNDTKDKLIVDLVLNQPVNITLSGTVYTVEQNNYPQTLTVDASELAINSYTLTMYKKYPRIMINLEANVKYTVDLQFDKIVVVLENTSTSIMKTLYIQVGVSASSVQLPCCLNQINDTVNVYTVAKPFIFNNASAIIDEDYTLLYGSKTGIGFPITNNLYILDEVRV